MWVYICFRSDDDDDDDAFFGVTRRFLFLGTGRGKVKSALYVFGVFPEGFFFLGSIRFVKFIRFMKVRGRFEKFGSAKEN